MEPYKAKLVEFRERIKTLCADAVALKEEGLADQNLTKPVKDELLANTILGYRHLEDSAMRFGKAIQAVSGGESPLGGPNTPGVSQA